MYMKQKLRFENFLKDYTEGETSISRAAELLQTDSSTAATTLKE